MTVADAVLVPLTPLDAIMGHLGLTVVYVFPPPAQSAPPYDLDRVRTSLISTIEEDYPLFVGEPFTDPVTGACFIRQTSETRAGGAQAIPFELDPHGTLTTDEAVRRPPMSLLPARDHNSELIKVKATLLSDGGLALGYNSSHALLDGEGLFTFMNVWGMHYRGLLANDRIVVNHDRHLVMPRGVGFTMPHPEFIQPQGVQPETPAGVEAKGGAAPLQFPETEAKPFHFTPEQLQSLKAKVSQGLGDGQFVSTIDVVTALFTVLITQARGHGQDIKITTGVNGRTRFDPPLPRHYAGNCIFNALSSYTTKELSMPVSVETIQRVALRIRASVLRRDEAFMRDAIEFIAQPSGRWVEMRPGVEFFFGADLMFTSWANMGMYKADFGAGTPVYAGPPTLLCDGMVIIMDAMNRATGLDVVPLLECTVMSKLTELWNACELLHQ